MSERGLFRLISCDNDDKETNVVVFGQVVADAQITQELKAEADELEALYGPNPYSFFLRRNGRRPDREQAASIGLLVGGRVMADDGTKQPPLSDGDRELLKGIKARRRAASRRYDHIVRLRDALAALSENQDDPADIIGGGSCLLNEREISEQLDVAVCWLTRFAREWHGREKGAGASGTDAVGSD